MKQWIEISRTVYVNKKSPYSNSNYPSSTVSNYCLTTVVLN